MKPENLQKVLTEGYAFDCETHKIQPGLLAPPLVCASVARGSNGEILDKEQALYIYKNILTRYILVGANIPYDNLVMAVHAARLGIDLLPLIFTAYDEERVYDIQLAEQLHALAEGHLGTFPDGSQFPRNPHTGKPQHYSLDVCCQLVLDRNTAKANDKWRLSYALLENIPISEWDPEARTYPVDDAVNTSDCAIAQVSPGYVMSIDPQGLNVAMRNRNLHNLSFQCYAHWVLHLGASWGFNVDPAEVEKVRSKSQAGKLKGQGNFLDLGMLKHVKEKGELFVRENDAAIKKRVADAYQCTGVCSVCDGIGKVAGATPCPKTLCTKDVTCKRCMGLMFKPKGCKNCDSTGYDLDSVPMPRTKTGLVSASRDSLYESGDEDLTNFAAWKEDNKILTTYIPWLERGIAEDGSLIPLNPRPKVLKETGRIGASTEHQLPREGGVRECIVARPGYLLGSCDWTGAELNTHAQSCLNLIGWSKMAELLNAGVDIHSYFGAVIGGVTYEHMIANRKTDTALGNLRQTAKPLDFGLPGFMGAATLVMQQRKQGPDTTAADGKVYKGLRFCILAGAESCGDTKVTEWKRRHINPTCLACLETAEADKALWMETFPENVQYFDFVKRVYDSGEMVQHWSNRVRGGATLCATANGYFQGMAGDLMKLAIIRMSREMYVDKSSDLYGTRLIIPIHDEALFEAPESQASAAAKRISAIMVDAMKEVCPDLAPAAKAEPALMRRWYKGAEAVWSDTGELLPWEPT